MNRLLFLLIVLLLQPHAVPLSRLGLLFSQENQRHLIALSRGPGEIFLSWRLLQYDPPDVTFNVYRANEIEGPYDLLSGGEGYPYTSFVDDTVIDGSTYCYLVKPLSGGGVEGEAWKRVKT